MLSLKISRICWIYSRQSVISNLGNIEIRKVKMPINKGTERIEIYFKIKKSTNIIFSKDWEQK